MSRRGLYTTGLIDAEEPAINLTPLIDVVFVILIMFIVIAPLLEMDGIELASAAKGASQQSSPKDSSAVSIHVRQDNTVWVNKQLVGVETLQQVLHRIRNEHPLATPQLFHDRKAHFGTYQAVKNAVEGAGFEQMDIVLQPD